VLFQRVVELRGKKRSSPIQCLLMRVLAVRQPYWRLAAPDGFRAIIGFDRPAYFNVHWNLPLADAPDFTIRFAAGDEDVQRLFHFLVFVSIPKLLAPVNAIDAVNEVNRVVNGVGTGDGFAVLAEIGTEIVGSLGIIKVPWWYNHEAFFLTDRFLFCFPALWNKGVGTRLLAEAGAISKQTELLMIINGHAKKRSNGIYFTKPLLIRPSEVDEMDWDAAAKKARIS
jgi:hypothetical protein